MDNRKNIPTRTALVAMTAIAFRQHAAKEDTKTEHALNLRERANLFEKKLAKETRGNPQGTRIQPRPGVNVGDQIVVAQAGTFLIDTRVTKVRLDGSIRVSGSDVVVGHAYLHNDQYYVGTSVCGLRPISKETADRIYRDKGSHSPGSGVAAMRPIGKDVFAERKVYDVKPWRNRRGARRS